MNEPLRELDDEYEIRERRRAVLAAILEKRADPILERIVAETVRATDFAGLGRTVAGRFATVARASLPVWLTALGAPDHERARIFEHNTHYVREMLGHGIPKFVQRSLVSFGFRLANTAARDAAPSTASSRMSSSRSYACSSATSRSACSTGTSGRAPSSPRARPSRRTQS